MTKIAVPVAFIISFLVLVTCTVSPPLGSSPVAESPPDEPPASDPANEPEDMAAERTVEDFTEFILSAEQVYRDIVLGDLFNSYMDPDTGEWVLSEYVEEAPDYRIDTPEGPYQSMSFFRHRILPSSGFTSIDELNAAVHEYWSEDFEVRSDSISSESIDFAELDGALYIFPAGASGIGDSFLGVIWELATFELLHLINENAVILADVYLTSYGQLYQSTLKWEIVGGKIVSRDLDVGDFVFWRDLPEAIDAMVTSGRWTQEYVTHSRENGWFEEQEAW